MSDVENPNPATDGTGEDGGTGDSGTILAGDGQQAQENLAELFTPEEVEAKKQAIEANKAEAERREKLTDEERAAEDAKKAEEEKKNAGAPEQYEFKVPEGTQLDPVLFEKFTPLAKELNLSQEKAQGLVDFYASQVLPEITRQQAEQWEGIKKTWGEEAKADKEYGGEKFDSSFALASKAMDQFATPELRNAMNEYGFGNHPEMVRLMVRIGKMMSEDNFIPPKAGGGEAEPGPRTFKYDKTK